MATKAKRRGHGEGSIHHRQDGRWMGTSDLGWENGKRKRKYVYAKTRKEVVAKLRKVQRDIELGRPVVDDRRELGQFLETWLDQVVKPTVRPTTYESYRGIVERHLLPTLGKVKLNKLAPAQIQALVAHQLDTGLSPRTVEYTWQVLRRALNVAVEWGLVRQNVADRVKPPRPRTQEVAPLSVAEIKAVLSAAEGHPLEAAFVVALSTGLRRGEILALTSSDLNIDTETPTLRVRGSLQRIDGRLRVTEPKSEKGRRTVAVPALAVAALRRQRARQAQDRLSYGEGWPDATMVFTTPAGTAVDPRNFHRQWHKLLEQAGLERRPLHHARHTAASLMLSEGVPLKVVQETLGHSTIQLTADRYGHLMPHDGQRVADAVDRALTA